MLCNYRSTGGLVRCLVAGIIFTALFAVAYAQSPLYTSNQNQYFLHGLARAGIGYLERDWLANTLDPTPVFSGLVEITYRITHLEIIFYFYYALLMGIYLISLLGIGINLFAVVNPAQKNLYLLLLAGMLIVIHSAALRFFLSRVLGINWTYLFEDGVADQRILGPVLQPSTFGVLLIASIYWYIKHKPYFAIFLAVLAASFHPTYLLSAATLTMLYMLLSWKNDQSLTKTISLGLLALILVTPILLYTYTSFGSTSSEVPAQAREILVNYRIPHHAQVDQWLDSTVVVKLMFVLAALYLSRHSGNLFAILLGSTLVASLLTVIQIVLGSDIFALLFPWRLSIYIVPLSTTIILAAITTLITSIPLLSVPNRIKFIKILNAAAIVMVVMVGTIRFKLDIERQENDPQRSLFSYVYTHKQAGELYLTPIKMQDFRLASGAPVFVDFKSIPYKDTDVLEWYRRVQLTDNLYKNFDCDQLKDMVSNNQITHVVIETSQMNTECGFLEITYQDQNFTLFKIIHATSNWVQ